MVGLTGYVGLQDRHGLSARGSDGIVDRAVHCRTEGEVDWVVHVDVEVDDF